MTGSKHGAEPEQAESAQRLVSQWGRFAPSVSCGCSFRLFVSMSGHGFVFFSLQALPSSHEMNSSNTLLDEMLSWPCFQNLRKGFPQILGYSDGLTGKSLEAFGYGFQTLPGIFGYSDVMN